MNNRITTLAKLSGYEDLPTVRLAFHGFDKEKFAKLIIEETLKQIDDRVYGRGQNSWYYDDDKKWVRHHFGYGELHE